MWATAVTSESSYRAAALDPTHGPSTAATPPSQHPRGEARPCTSCVVFPFRLGWTLSTHGIRPALPSGPGLRAHSLALSGSPCTTRAAARRPPLDRQGQGHGRGFCSSSLSPLSHMAPRATTRKFWLFRTPAVHRGQRPAERASIERPPVRKAIRLRCPAWPPSCPNRTLSRWEAGTCWRSGL